MAQVVRCTDCGAYYNGQYYSVCPHCKKGHAESVPKPEQTDAPQKPDVKKDEPSVYVSKRTSMLCARPIRFFPLLSGNDCP